MPHASNQAKEYGFGARRSRRLGWIGLLALLALSCNSAPSRPLVGLKVSKDEILNWGQVPKFTDQATQQKGDVTISTYEFARLSLRGAPGTTRGGTNKRIIYERQGKIVQVTLIADINDLRTMPDQADSFLLLSAAMLKSLGGVDVVKDDKARAHLQIDSLETGSHGSLKVNEDLVFSRSVNAALVSMSAFVPKYEQRN